MMKIQLTFISLFALLDGAVDAQQPVNSATHRVTICHRTCSETNPWNRQTIDLSAWEDTGNNKHSSHTIDKCNGIDDKEAVFGPHTSDYMIEDHGSRDQIEAKFENDAEYMGFASASAYWAYWEPTCNFQQANDCCVVDGSWEHCCGVEPTTSAPTKAPTIDEETESQPPAPAPTGSLGDPHFRTWKNEHFEYHGQCDLVLAKDKTFANGLGIDVHIRTKLIRFWSYIKQAAIRIGDDILEVEGTIDKKDNYWINFEPAGELTTIGGFPVTSWWQNSYKRHFLIDLHSKFPNQKIQISTYKEFVRVDFLNSTAEAFGNTVGILGDFNSGKTFARDGSTVLDNFMDLGNEWQVLPDETMIFHDVADPQFPKKCLEPEDPQGQRRRRLGESTVSVEDAEKACATLTDPLDRKDCVYDILATQDISMVGAF